MPITKKAANTLLQAAKTDAQKESLVAAFARCLTGKWDDTAQKLFEEAFPDCYLETDEYPALKWGTVRVEGNEIIFHRGGLVGRPLGDTVKARVFIIPT